MPLSPRERRRRIGGPAAPAARTTAPLSSVLLLAVIVLAMVAFLVWAVPALGRVLDTPGLAPKPLLPTAASQSASSAAPQPTPEPTPEPEPTPAPIDTADPAAMDAAWAQLGSRFMDWLVTQEGYQSLDLSVRERFPYLICVNRAANCITVYQDDGTGRYTRPYLAMACSAGSETPLGVFTPPVEQYHWRMLSGGSFGQYSCRISGSSMFQSFPYASMEQDALDEELFARLGSTIEGVSSIRLAAVDAKWIFDEIRLGTTVVIYDNAEDPGPMGCPEPVRIDSADGISGWDPTDPDPANPYGTRYLDLTAIRSVAALADWETYKTGDMLEGLASQEK